MKRTIPEIAEELRHHINNDNDAPRLIVEHILPLLGVEVDSSQRLKELISSDSTLREIRDELNGVITALTEYADDTYDGLDVSPSRFENAVRKLERIEFILTP